ncbi:hypothetical protein [Kutzneria kofuensis]|uniref:Uncharacterized protein n=1 Tax=Kutzneria kofuensis TaxID=103725 RepID=A0A7W9KH92_9PSEU|nr:hypothetical protein [Kutzneria kofuensis]MBB5892405.1 hypothetical protein [Kutzneria kofuensis]
MIISVDSLPSALEAIGIDDHDVSIGETADNRWCIVLRGTGRWSVFYNEADACYAFLGRMTVLQITRDRFQFADEMEE